MTQEQRNRAEQVMHQECIRIRNRFMTVAVVVGTWLAIVLS